MKARFAVAKKRCHSESRPNEHSRAVRRGIPHCSNLHRSSYSSRTRAACGNYSEEETESDAACRWRSGCSARVLSPASAGRTRTGHAEEIAEYATDDYLKRGSDHAVWTATRGFHESGDAASRTIEESLGCSVRKRSGQYRAGRPDYRTADESEHAGGGELSDASHGTNRAISRADQAW